MFFVLSFLLAGAAPQDFYHAIINAQKQDMETLKFFALDSQTGNPGNEYGSGWWNADKAKGEASLGEASPLLHFSDTNSAFYSGGNDSLVLGRWQAGEAIYSEAGAVVEENRIPEEAASTSVEIVPLDIDSLISGQAKQASGTDLVAASGTNPEIAAPEHAGRADEPAGFAEEEASSDDPGSLAEEAGEADDFPASEEVATSPLNSEQDTEKEISEAPLPAEESAGKEDFSGSDRALGEENTDSQQEKSENTGEEEIETAADDSLGFLPGVRPALAQEERFLEKISSFEELGEFESARIRVSLAMFSYAETKEAKPGLPEGAKPLSGTVEREETGSFGTASSSAKIEADNTAASSSREQSGARQEDGAIEPETDPEYPPQSAIFEEEGTSEDPDATGQDAKDAFLNDIYPENSDQAEHTEEEPEIEIIDQAVQEAEVSVEEPQTGIGDPVVAEPPLPRAVPAEPVNDSQSSAGEELGWLRFLNQARAQAIDDAIVEVWYTVDPAGSSTNIVWKKFARYSGQSLSNSLNGGYFDYEAPFIRNWQDLENLQLKFIGLANESVEAVFYLDSAWVEADFLPSTKYKRLTRKGIWDGVIELISSTDTFSALGDIRLRFRYHPLDSSLWEGIFEALTGDGSWNSVDIKARLLDTDRRSLDVPLSMVFQDDYEFTVSFSQDNSALSPGKYYIEFIINDEKRDEEASFVYSQPINWGVLAINFNKSVYKSGEQGLIQMAVLDENGHTICDADIELKIVSPSGQITSLRSVDQEIIRGKNCGPETITSDPDYSAYYYFDQAGSYEITLAAETDSGTKVISETIEAQNSPFSLERIGPTRIFPKADYAMSMIAKFEEDYSGSIIESLPLGFKIKNYKLRITNSSDRDPFGPFFNYSTEDYPDKITAVWQGLELLAGDELLIEYEFDAPDVSPELYLLGPAVILNEAKEPADGSRGPGFSVDHFYYSADSQSDSENDSGFRILHSESRKWQIASDAVSKRARTVMLPGGVYNGSSSSGQNTNADYTFSQFNFRLAESGVEIKNAYILFEAQIEAYDSSGGNYTGYKLYFDSCEETCTANALGSGGGQVAVDNSNILAYDEAESNQMRLLLDVTEESGLQGYTGAGAEMEAQIGYRIKNGTSKASIANARSLLFLTYEYDRDSQNITNTVVYPLDSTAGTDRGSRQASQNACTADYNCPKFSYQVEIPEWPGIATSVNRVAQWYKMFDHNDSNNSSDIDPYIDIENYNVDSDPMHHECANSGTQGNMPGFIYPEWLNSGYAENEAQELEYYLNSGTNYIVGGEVYETYIASSSASVKTRTVSFPLGVLTNGGDTNTHFKGVEVYFPENGTASGTVEIKSAWFRIKTHNQNSANLNVQVSSKIGANATSSALTYAYNGGGMVKSPLIDIVHIIPSADYESLEEANNSSPVEVRLLAAQSATTFGGLSAELMITYTYSSEQTGYLTSLNLFGGQSTEDPLIATTTLAAPGVMPESGGKTVYAGGLIAHFLNSDSSGDVPGGSTFLLDANLSTSSPICSVQYLAEPADVNSYTEMIKDVTSALTTSDGQVYYACYADEESAPIITTEGAVMGGQLVYTYGWENTAPSSTLLSGLQKTDGSRIMDLSMLVFDPDGHESRVKIEYATGTACDFSSSGDPYLDETDANISAVYLDPAISNNNEYQVGNDSAFVHTASGTNTVYFDWLLESLGAVESEYCLRITANDMFLDQEVSATGSVYVDTVDPDPPGALSLNSRTGSSVTLNYGAASTEANFNEYKIFYKLADGTAPDENDSVWASTSDPNLYDVLFNGAATTTITGLSASTTYSFSIWAYDDYGNRASSSYVDIVSNDAPVSSFNSVSQRTNGSGIADISIEVDDLNNQNFITAKLEYEAGGSCGFNSPQDPSLSENPSNILADFGTVVVDNYSEYQIGSSTGYIMTSPGANSVEFDWLSYIDESAADGEYCLRLTAYDTYDNQSEPATTTIVLDNVDPVPTGGLAEGLVTTQSIQLIYATSSPASDTNEPTVNAYRIFYKKGTAGVTTGDTEIDNSHLNAYDYNSGTSTVVSGLDQNTYYVFNIWSYDSYGNSTSSSELVVKTGATVKNDSLVLVNPLSEGLNNNILAADSQTEYIFRATVSESNGWPVLSSTTLKLANWQDDTAPYDDLVFYWNQTQDAFYESGFDMDNAAALSPNSTSTCLANTCILDFHIIFNKDFSDPSIDYTASLYTGNDSFTQDIDHYANFYEVRFTMVSQNHYRWRNDDGGE